MTPHADAGEAGDDAEAPETRAVDRDATEDFSGLGPLCESADPCRPLGAAVDSSTRRRAPAPTNQVEKAVAPARLRLSLPTFSAGIDEGEKELVIAVVRQATYEERVSAPLPTGRAQMRSRAKRARDGWSEKFPQVHRSVHPATPRGVREIEDVLRRYSDPTTEALPWVAIESERTLVAQVLVEDGFDVFYVEPTRTSSFREALRMGPDKSDGRDSYALACAPLLVDGDLRPVRLLTGLDAQMSMLAHRQRRAVSSSKAAAQSVRSTLRRYWPVFADRYQAAGLRKTPWVRDLLRAYPDPAAFVGASPQDLADVVSATRQRAVAQTVKNQLVPLQADTEVVLPPDQREAYVSAVVAGLNALELAVSAEQQLLSDLLDAFQHHMLRPVLLSLPGMGELTAARMAAAIGENPHRFADQESLALYAGCKPQFRGSGTVRMPRRRKNCNHLLHAAVREWTNQVTIDRTRKESEWYGDGRPHVYSPGARWVYEHHLVKARRTAEQTTDPKLRRFKRSGVRNHALRVTGERLCYGLWHMLNSVRIVTDPTTDETFIEWDAFDEERTFKAAYDEMRRQEELNAKRPPEDRLVIPVKAPDAETAAELRRVRRKAKSGAAVPTDAE